VHAVLACIGERGACHNDECFGLAHNTICQPMQGIRRLVELRFSQLYRLS